VCYLCGRPLDFMSMQVDHVIPESLEDRPEDLRAVLEKLGRPADFSIQSYENWMPACGPCNGRKLNIAFEPSGWVQMTLQRVAMRAPKARELEQQAVTKRQIGNALSVLQRIGVEAPMDPKVEAEMRELLDASDKLRTTERQGKELRLAPLITVLQEKGGITIVRGPYGVGGGPTNPSPAMRCGVCGNPYFNGARCVICGNLDED
jgi:hypothetical protein